MPANVVPFGSTRQADLGPGAAAFIDQIAEQVYAKVKAQPTAPNVVVHPPNVRVESPTVQLTSPAVAPPDVIVNVEPTEVEGLRELAAEQAKTNQLLTALSTLLAQPVIKTVERDSYQNIVRVIERRGN